jgi:leucyl/phenylalanyl-tRNA--protein transferase
MPVYLLPREPVFPPAAEAEADGLLAIGGDMSVERLVTAYASGIFPWFIEEGDIYWFSPDPRMVLFPEKFRISPSLLRIIKSGRFEVRMDHDFRSVISNCSGMKRSHDEGTWISQEFIEGYTELHRKGFAHSIEPYLDGQLAGGLYGVSLGKAFFGESMFYTEKNASKVALYHLVEIVSKEGFHFIDCQVETEHFRRMGAELISRKEYLALLRLALSSRDFLYHSGTEGHLEP